MTRVGKICDSLNGILLNICLGQLAMYLSILYIIQYEMYKMYKIITLYIKTFSSNSLEMDHINWQAARKIDFV